jgi:hypothetical protein
MAFVKDSLIIVVSAAQDGYSYALWKWDESPPPGPIHTLNTWTTEAGARPVHTQRVAANKTELKTELGSVIDTQFDV